MQVLFYFFYDFNSKTPSECFALLQQVTKKKQCQELVLLNGTNDSEKVKKNVRTIKRSSKRVTSRVDSNIDRVKQLVHVYRGLTVRMIFEELFIGRDTVWKILTKNLKMRKLCAKIVPKILSEYQKQRRLTVYQDITERL